MTGFVSKVFKIPVYFVKSRKDCFAASTISPKYFTEISKNLTKNFFAEAFHRIFSAEIFVINVRALACLMVTIGHKT